LHQSPGERGVGIGKPNLVQREILWSTVHNEAFSKVTLLAIAAVAFE
jgi:hypothetical protein